MTSSRMNEIKAPTLLVFGWVGVFVGSRGELVKSGVFLYTSVELQHLFKNVFCFQVFLKKLLNSIVYSSHARHVSTWLIVPASYDEYTALVKSGIVASKHVWRAVSGTYRWWKPGYRDLLSNVTFLLDMWPVLCFFSFSTRELV